PRAFAPAGGSLRSETDVSFDLSRAADVTVRVYSAAGRLERVVARDLPLARGRNTLTWNGRDEDGRVVASGLYVVVVTAGGAQGEQVVAVVR
ncbi:MAG: FlgD immunoglobulin-like domain containing protein, partial [Gemmatimonadota bacterium]